MSGRVPPGDYAGTSPHWLREPGVMKAMLSEYLKYCLAGVRAFAGARSWSGLRADMTGS